ncbi:MAG: GTPase [archaeon]
MPVNPGIQYQLAEGEFNRADNAVEKLKALQKMFATVPRHKSSEGLQKEIKTKIAKYKQIIEKEKQSKKGKSYLSIKKEGAAFVCILGKTNTGKSTLLSKLTNAKPLISEFKFTTKMPEVGVLDYKGVKIQIVEMPAIIENYINTENGGFFLGVIRNADLLIFTFKNEKEIDFIKNELEKNDIKKRYVLFYKDIERLKRDIWNNINLIKVYTRGKDKKTDNKPVALKKGSKIRDLAITIHKDFLKKIIKNDGKTTKIITSWARVWGKSVKYDGCRVGVDHVLEDDDIVELHVPND